MLCDVGGCIIKRDDAPHVTSREAEDRRLR